MFDYQKHITELLSSIKSDGRYRIFQPLEKDIEKFPIAKCRKTGKPITIWCSNDYLGMGSNPHVLQAMQNALNNDGAGAGGTRNISGNHHYVSMAEDLIADLHCKQAGLLFTSGYVANEASISTLAKIFPDTVIFSDQGNHASIIQGVKLSGAEKHVFRHNDLQHLESLLQKFSLNRPKIIIFESIYSMDGDFGKISAICNLAKKYNAITYLDEVHAVGLYGSSGAGIAEKMGIADKVDIIQGSFGKAFGVMGGYVAGNSNIIDAIRSFASGFIFTTALPPVLVAGIIASIKYLRGNNLLRIKHQESVAYLKKMLDETSIKYLPNDSHIISIVIGDAHLCKNIGDTLLNNYSIYVQPINYPTVDKGKERFRITPTPYHNKEMMINLVEALKSELPKHCLNTEANSKSYHKNKLLKIA